MTEQAVTNSTCLIALERIGHLPLLPQLFVSVLAPPAVQAEFGQPLPWLAVVDVQNHPLLAALRTQVDEGEAQAIALALERGEVRIILDDKKARRVARQMGLQMIGTMGVLVRAKHAGLLPAVGPALQALQEAGFRMVPALHHEALRLAGEVAD